MMEHRHENGAGFAQFRIELSVAVDIFLWRLGWGVNRVVGQVEKEGIVFLSVDKVYRLLREASGGIALVLVVLEATFVDIDGLLVIAAYPREFEVVMSPASHEQVAFVKAAAKRMPL